MTRRVLKIAHRWLGLLLMLPMLVQGVSGCFLALTPPWEALQSLPRISALPPQPDGVILAAAVQSGDVATRYQPARDGAPAMVDIAASGGAASLQVMLDPGTLAVLQTRRIGTTYSWVHQLHESMLLQVVPGRSIVGWCGVGLFLLGLSGIVLWWPAPGRWRGAFSVTGRMRGLRFQRELHNAAGIWAFAMLIVMSVSGVTLAFPQTIRAMVGLPGFQPSRRTPPEPLDLGAVLRQAAAAIPGGRVADVRLPSARGPFAGVRLSLPDGDTAMAVISASGARVVSVTDPRTQTPAASVLSWLRALHYGEAFGPPWRVLVVANGLALPLLAVTGVSMWLLRHRNRRRLSAQRQNALQGAAE